MSVNAVLTGFPTVLQVRISQGCGAEPGRIVVDTAVTVGSLGVWPKTTNLTVNYNGTTLTWNDLRVITAPRVRAGYMRTVLEDSRWKLKYATLSDSWNRRDSCGTLLASTGKTLAQLCALIGAASNLSIVVGSNPPAITPPARFAGRKAAECLRRLIEYSVGRLYYNPFTGNYELHGAGLGSLPDLTNNMVSTGPPRALGGIYVHSAPILYEGRFTATAVYDRGDGTMQAVPNANKYYSGFSDTADPVQRSRLLQGAMRLWLVSNTTVNLVPFRAMSILAGAEGCTYAGPKLIRHELADQMVEHPAMLDEVDVKMFPIDNGGYLIYSSDPFLSGGGTTATLLTGYRAITAGRYNIQTETRSVGAGSSVLDIIVPWIRPIQSSEPDMPATQWSSLLSAVANAHRNRFINPSIKFHTPGIVPMPPSGRIGRVEYRLAVQPRPIAETLVAFDFDPHVMASLR